MTRFTAWAAAAFLVFFIAHNPGGAAAVGKSLLIGLADIGAGVGDFINRAGVMTAGDVRMVTVARRLRGVARLCEDLARLDGDPAVTALLGDVAAGAREQAARLNVAGGTGGGGRPGGEEVHRGRRR